MNHLVHILLFLHHSKILLHNINNTLYHFLILFKDILMNGILLQILINPYFLMILLLLEQKVLLLHLNLYHPIHLMDNMNNLLVGDPVLLLVLIMMAYWMASTQQPDEYYFMPIQHFNNDYIVDV